MQAMPATTPPALRHLEPRDAESTPRLPFSTKGKVPVATTIVLFTIVGALIAFIAIVGTGQ
jgi:hypothetical protein